MDQEPLVNEQIDIGNKLIEAVADFGYDVQIAFWAKPTEFGKWYLYLASSVVDDSGPAVAYRLVFDVLRKHSDLWIDPLDIKVIGAKDSLAQAAFSVVRPKIPASPFAIPNPKPYPGMTRFGGSALGGMSVDGAIIYPPRRTIASV